MPNNREMKPDVFKRAGLRNVQVKPGIQGPVWRSLILSAEMDGAAPTNGLRAEFRLFENEKRLECHFALRKLPVPTPEAVYVAFPFQAPGGRMLYEAQGGMVTPGGDQIPGSSSDWQTLQSVLTVRDDTGQIFFGSEQVPLVQLGEINLGKWMPVTRVERPHVYSWVMNNYWFTNFRAEQEGEFRWHYYLTSTRDKSRTTATRFGWGSRVPLVTRVLPTGKSAGARIERSLSTFAVRAPNVLVVEARPAREGNGVYLHFRELEGQYVTLSGDDLATLSEVQRGDEINVLEETVRADIESLALPPYGVRFVRLEF
jgi:hypothetical protein